MREPVNSFQAQRRTARERRRAREKKEQERLRKLWMAQRLVVAVAVVLAGVLVIWLVVGILSPKTEEEPDLTAGATPVPQVSESPEKSGVLAAQSQLPSQVISPVQPVQLADPLLVLVNGETPLPDDWTCDLVPVTEDSDVLVDSRMLGDLNAMTEAARQEDMWFWVSSGYRSAELQEDLVDREISRLVEEGMTREQAEAETARLIQAPGHSEHHTGLAVDFNTADGEFTKTEEYAWLKEHAAEYGFIQRYPEDKVDITGISVESWHFRYVGREHAMEMKRLGFCLEEYVTYLKR